MSPNITPVGPIRSTVWQGSREGLIMCENPDGSIDLIRSSDCDDGPSRSVKVLPEAVGPLSAKLWALAVDRRVPGLSQAMALAQHEIAGRV